jgi:hypothetical protein
VPVLSTLILAAAVAQTPTGTDSIFIGDFDVNTTCPDSITTPAGVYTRREVGNIYYLPEHTIRPHVDLAHFENIWGHLDNIDVPWLWPGRAGSSPSIDSVPRMQYVAARFHVPADISSLATGMFKNVIYGQGPAVDFSISQQCGDFNPQQTACAHLDSPANDRPMVAWRIGAATDYFCHLDPGADYYVNVKISDPNAQAVACSPSSCSLTILNYESE